MVIGDKLNALDLLSKFTKHLQGMIYQFRLLPDRTTQIPYASEHIKELFGLTLADVEADASPLLALIHTEDFQHFIALSKESEQNLTPWSCEFRICHPDGTIRWFYGNSSPERESDGSTLWTGYVKDITESKEFKQRAIMSDVAQESLLDTIPDLLFETNQEGICLEVYSITTTMLSNSREMLIGKPIHEFLTQQASQVVMQAVAESSKHGHSHGKQYSIELTAKRYWFELSVAKITHDKSPRYLVLSRDITLRKQIEEKLWVDTVAFNTVSQGIVVTDKQLKIIAINDAYTKITGYTLDELIGKPPPCLLPNHLDNETLNSINQALESKQEYFGELLSTHKNGGQYWGELTITPVFGDNNQNHLTNYIGVLRDISDRKSAQEKLDSTQRALVQSNERLFDLYEFAPIGYLTLDQKGIVTEANWKARSLLGIKRKDLGAIGFSRYLTFESKRFWKSQFSLLNGLENGGELEFELRLSKDDGSSSIDVKLSCICAQVENHNVIRITLFDITKMRHTETQLKQQEAYQRSLLDNFPYMVWLKDENGRLLTVNRAYISAAGKSELCEMVGKTDLDFWPTELAKAYMADDKDVFNSGKSKTIDELIEINGRQVWFETYKSPVIVGEKIVGTVGFARNISDSKKAFAYEQFKNKMLELVVLEENLQVTLDSINNGIEQLNSEMFCLIALMDKSGKTLSIVSAPSLPQVFVDALRSIKVGMGMGSIGTAAFLKQRVIVEDIATHPYWSRNKEIALASGIGSSWAQPILDAKGRVLGAFGIYHHAPQLPNENDIALIEQSAHLISIALERRSSDSKIEYLAYYDDLTGLPNRRFLFEQLKRAVSMNQETGAHGALLYIDIDQFKTINDSRGHDVGDLLLIDVAERLKSCLHAADVVARVSGDEFVVLLETLEKEAIVSAKQVETVAERILKVFSRPFKILKQRYYVSASIGIALFSKETLDVEEILKQSDIAMYQAKDSGRNAFRFFDPKVQRNITALAGLEAELRDAIKSDELQLFYQVQVDHLGQPFGAEALIRWIHPKRGMIPPMQFIPLAEESGLIVPLGLWILDTACAQLKAWQAHPSTSELTLSVNISAKQFKQRNFTAEVKNLIEKYAIDPANLRMELTESVLLDDVEQTIEYMHALGQLGVQFSLDDFGTGYSSLQYLKRLPLYQLKIDQSFVRDIVTDSHDRTIVRTIIAMAQSMYISVIAEGVETKEQQELLLTNGCRRYQGYYFGRPVPIDEFNQMFFSKETGIN
jgi:diguanylate cyclase (GGDEF)-like protein/PAS domain S-box-containing protein